MLTRAAAVLAGLLVGGGVTAAPPDFDRDVAPILAARCLDCHSGDDAKGEVDLTRRASAVGPKGAVRPGKLDESSLWAKVAADEMPPKRPLSAAEKAVLKEWIASGAKWGTDPIDPFAATTATRGPGLVEPATG